jgi:RHS repeat-associated protein
MAKSPDCTVSFVRDPLGRTLTELQGDYEISYQYDSVGRVIRVTTSAGHTARYGYGPSGVCTMLEVGRQSLRFRHDARRREVARLLPGGVTLTHSYDRAGRLSSQRLEQSMREPAARRKGAASQGQSSQAVNERSYSYNSVGWLVQAEDSEAGRTHYEYDDMEHIIASTVAGGGSERFTYDVTGNVAEISQWEAGGREGLRTACTYGAGSRLMRCGDRAYEYDPEGRLKRMVDQGAGKEAREWFFSWDALDQLRSVQSPEGGTWRYVYDALGRRIQKIGPDGTTRYVWDQDVIVHELSDAHVQRTWVYLPGTLTPLCETRGDDIYAVVPDHHGSVVGLVNSQGGVAWSCNYKLWGQVSSERGAISCNFRFPGQWSDEETGFHYSRYRYYDPQTGRYISQDPSRLVGGWNPYAYAANPINWIDPYGLATVFRGMRRDSDGQPVVYSGPPTGNGQNNAANSLGLRPTEPAMSSGVDPSRLDENRRPPAFGGNQRQKQGDAGIFGIDEAALAKNGLRLDPNDMDGNHRSIVPVEPQCPRDEFERRIAATRDDWKEMTPEEARKRMEEEKAVEGCGVSE